MNALVNSSANPIAELRRQLIANGYRYVPTRGKRPAGDGWQNFDQDPNKVEEFVREFPSHTNTGLLTGEVVAIDIDAPTADVAEKLIERLIDVVPAAAGAPYRIGKAPKALFIFRASEPRRKLMTGKYIIDGHKHQVEVMGIGQQIVAFGVHPETKKPYQWSNGDPLTVPLADLPEITPSEVDDFLADAEAILAAHGERDGPEKRDRPSAGGGDTFWTRVNSAALASADRWVKDLFPTARQEAGTGAWRISSKDLGRSLEEDISVHSGGAQDFGLERPETPIGLVQQWGGAPTPKDAAFWICERLGINPADLGWEPARPSVKVSFSSSKPAPVADNDDERQMPVPPPMHPDPFNPSAAGGILGEIAEWITSTAIIKVSELSLMSSAALVGAMFGDKALGPTNSGVNLFVTTIVKTAGGKGRPPKAIRALADKAGVFGAVSNGDPTSYAAFERIIRKKPSVVAVMDEFGITLQGVNGKKSDAAAVSIRKFLLAVYDQSDSVFDGRVYASSETKKDDSPIFGPALTVLGMTTPETLYRGISPESVSDGFLNRFVFVEAGEPDSEIRPPDLNANNTPPAALVAKVQRAISVFPGKAAGPNVPKYSVPFEGGQGSEAHKAWEAVFMWQHHRAWTQTERDINGRVAENTIRLATVRAISRKPAVPAITVEDVQWAWAIVHRSVGIIDHGVKNMTGSDPEALRKAIVEALRAARNGELYRSRLMKRSGVKQASMNEYIAAVSWLYASGEVEDVSADCDGSKLRLVSQEQ